MLDKNGFDLWADGYDKTVGISDEENAYSFAGYRDVLGSIFQVIMEKHYDFIVATYSLHHLTDEQTEKKEKI